jgi:hypothetical protein
VVLFSLLPKRYKVAERLTQTVIFWSDQEAFLFFDVNITGQSSNIVQEKLAAMKYGFWALLVTRGPTFYENGVTAYHLNHERRHPGGLYRESATGRQRHAHGRPGKELCEGNFPGVLPETWSSQIAPGIHLVGRLSEAGGSGQARLHVWCKHGPYRLTT